MNGRTTVSAVGGLLVGLVLAGHPVAAQTLGDGLAAGATAAIAAGGAVAGQGSGRGPVAALGAARSAAQAESRRAAETDAGMAAATDATAPVASGAPAPRGVASGPAAATAPASTGPASPETAALEAAGTPGTDGAETASRYDAALHRDPFRPPALRTTVADTGAHTPLERYQIGQLKLVGVVQGVGAARAMVEDSSGLGYIISAGTSIGSSGGIVRRIEPRRVMIEETVTNFYGDKEPREVVMELPQEDRSP